MSTYLREIERARRDLGELIALVRLAGPMDLTVTEFAQAIGLADTAHRALLSAFGATHVTPAVPPAVTSRRGLDLIGRTP